MVNSTLFDDRYQVDWNHWLGEGRFAKVYPARNTRPDALIPEIVALKILKPSFTDSPDADRRFRDEAHLMYKIKHAHIVQIYHAGRAKTGEYYLAMRLIQGQNLLELCPLSWDRARLILVSLVDALEYLHNQGIVHGDVKPANTMVDELDVAYLVDLGLARVVGYDRLQTQTGDRAPGTLYYMAPELWRGELATHATDLYALAATLYEMLTGRKLVELEHFSLKGLMDRHCSQPHNLDLLSRVSGLPWPMSVLHTALDKRPENRYPSVNDFYKALVESRPSPVVTDWGLGRVPLSLPSGNWQPLVHVGAVYDVLLLGSYVWGATDVGAIRWRKNTPTLFTVAHGLPDQCVYALATARGEVWIGTAQGLCWGHEPPFENVRALAGIEVRDVWASQDTIWAATSKGLVRLDDRGENLYWYQLDLPPSADLRCVHHDGRRLWVGLQCGVICLDESAGRPRTFTAGDATGFPAGEVRTITSTQDGRVWVATSEGLAYYQHHYWKQPGWAQGSVTGYTNCLVPASNDLWLGGERGLSRYEHIKRVIKFHPDPCVENIRALGLRNDESVIAATDQRILEFNPYGEYRADLPLPSAPLDDDVYTLAIGRGNELWIGSRQGVSRRQSDRWELHHFSKNRARNAIYGRGPVVALVYCTDDDSLWVAGQDGGLSLYSGGYWRSVQLPGLDVGHVRVLFSGSDGVVWVGTDAGLRRIGTRQRRPEYVESCPKVAVSSIAETETELWVGTARGLQRFERQSQQLCYGNRSPIDEILALCVTKDGSVWAGTRQGAVRFAREGPLFLPGLQGCAVVCICQTQDGALWFGTQDRGLARFNGRRVSWISEDKLPHRTVRALAQTPDGALWVATAGGLVCFSPYRGSV